ncbi:MAG TPA: hypothetical protein VI588_03895, partial [Candidatus Gracilibacteria bacterium]|nr:hypothetical protein [Candidatus Gracilibacteria bacterium]
MAIAAFAMVLSGCSRAVAPSLPTQETTDPVETMETILPVSPMPESGGKLIACNTDADCVPNPS